MLFDAGRYGMIEVDEVYTNSLGFLVGVQNPDTIHRVTYTYGGPKLGCTRVSFSNTQEPDMPKLRQALSKKAGEILMQQMTQGVKG